MSERHYEQTCFKLSAWPTPVIDIVHNSDVNNDIVTPGRPVRLRTGHSWYGQRTITYIVLAGVVGIDGR